MKTFCIFCGTQMYDGALFCHACGKRQPEQIATEPVEKISASEAEISENTPANETAKSVSTYESEAVSETLAETSEPPRKAVAEPTDNAKKCGSKKGFLVRMIRNSVLLAVAITLFALSFAPIFKWEFDSVQDIQDIEFDVPISAIDGIAFMFDSGLDYDLEDLQDSRMYEKLENMIDDLADIGEKYDEDDDFDDLSLRDQRKVTRYIVASYRLALQSENVKTNISHVMVGIFAILYFLITLSFLTFAALNFAAGFGCLSNARRFIKQSTFSLLAAMPAVIFTVYAVFFAYLSGIPSASGVAMGGGAVASLVISLVAIAATIAFAYIFKQHKRKFNIVLRAVSATLALLVICTCFAPVFTTSVEAVFENRERKSEVDLPIYFSWYENCLLTDSEQDALDELRDSNSLSQQFIARFGVFETFTKNEVRDGAANTQNSSYLVMLLGSTSKGDALSATALISLLFIVTVISAGIVLEQNLICFMGGKSCGVLNMVAKILTASFATFAFIANLIVLVSLGYSVIEYAPIGYGITIAAGIIFMLIFAIATVAVPSGKEE